MSEVQGKLIIKNETKEYGSNGFKKREFVIETDSQYPQKIIIELIKDKCELLDSYSVGDDIKVNYNLNGREWINPQGEAKYFNSIQGWRIESLSQAAPAQELPPLDQFAPAPDLSNDEPDDLPF
jgi:hypothetical protein